MSLRHLGAPRDAPHPHMGGRGVRPPASPLPCTRRARSEEGDRRKVSSPRAPRLSDSVNRFQWVKPRLDLSLVLLIDLSY